MIKCILNFRCVTLDKCRKLTIVLGPIENTLQLNYCEECLVIAPSRRAVLVACRKCTLHLAVQSRPIFIQPPVPSVIASNSQNINNSGSVTCNSANTSVGGLNSCSNSIHFSGNEEILLAPFHTVYVRLAEHMNRVNLNSNVNYWDNPFLLGMIILF